MGFLEDENGYVLDADGYLIDDGTSIQYDEALDVYMQSRGW